MAAFVLFLCLLVPLVLACAVRARKKGAGGRSSSGGGGGKKGGSSSLPLPPGSMGWPYVGETTQLYSSKNPNVFFARKRNKYGPIFKTHILGCPCVMVSSPEAAKFVLVTQAHLFKPTFPASKERMLGPQAIFFQQGDYHAHLRRLVSRAFSPEAIRGSVPAIEAIALRSLGSWEDLQVNTFQEMKTYALNVALLSIFGEEEMQYIEELKQCYLTLEKGYNSMPVNLPGTLFHKAMKARKRLGAIVAHIISARRERERGSDLLGSFMDGREALTDDQIADNAIGVIFAARDTTASVLTWMVKFLGDNPAVLKAVTVRRARRDREGEGVVRRGAVVGRHAADAGDGPGDPGDDAGGVHPLLHLQGGRGGRGVPRVPDSQGLESASPVPEHPPQPRPLPLPRKVRPFTIRGGPQAQHVHAVRERDPLVPRQRAGQAGDARPLPPPRHQVQMVHLQVRERRPVRPLRPPHQRPPHDLHPQGQEQSLTPPRSQRKINGTIEATPWHMRASWTGSVRVRGGRRRRGHLQPWAPRRERQRAGGGRSERARAVKSPLYRFLSQDHDGRARRDQEKSRS
uniref:Abscisic acid 8'-hydroxylase 1 n=1 Tax=Triticum urartu TaxID=4572 RepID=A0A8R7QVA1_TRIUA